MSLHSPIMRKKILRRFGHFDCKPTATPFDVGCKLEKNKGNAISQLEYSQVIESLMYLMNSTRPDLAYAVNRLSRYTSNLAQEHWDALVRVLRYLKNTLDYELHYTKYPPVVEGFSDANWNSDTTKIQVDKWICFYLGRCNNILEIL